MTTRDELQKARTAIRSLADGRRVWAKVAESYSRSAAVNAKSVQELRALPTDRVDPVAVECVTELADFLALQRDLLQKSADQCSEMATLFAAIHVEGDAFDWDSPKGKEYERREADLTARMKQVVENEGAAEKQRLRELEAKAKAARATLAEKHGREFPDLFGD